MIDQILAATVSPLTFESPLKSVALPLGKPAKLEAKLNVNPDGPQSLPEITWFKDGLPIGDRHKKSFNPIDGSMALYIDYVTPVDSGVYAVVAEIENAQPTTSSAPVHVVSDVKATPPEVWSESSSSGRNEDKEEIPEEEGPSQSEALLDKPEACIEGRARSGSRGLESPQQESPYRDIVPDGTDQPTSATLLSPKKEGNVETSMPIRESPARREVMKGNSSSSQDPPRSPSVEKQSLETKSFGDATPTHSTHADGVVEKPDRVIVFDALLPPSEKPGECVDQPAETTEDAKNVAPLRISGTAASKRPIFLWKLEPLEVPVGECIKLQTKVTLNDDGSLPDIEWQMNNKSIPELSKISASPDGCLELRVPKARLEDGGLYRVTASNECGEAETSSTVTVLSKPSPAPLFLEKLTPVQVNEGDPVSMTTRVTLDDEGHLPLIEWFKDGQRIDSDRCQRKILANGTLTLNIDQSKLQDAGTYLVRASNAEGEAETSAPVGVTPSLGTPKFAQPLSPKILHEGDNDQMEAAVSPNADGSLPEVSWLKDGEPLKVDDHIVPFKLPDGRIGLKFSNAALADVAKYTAVLTNPDGNKTESTAPVEVTPKSKAPKFEQALQPLEIDEGSSGEIRGKIRPNEDGSMPTVTWLKDGQPLEADDQAKPFTSPDGTIGLHFSAARPSDAANYTAILRNPDTDEEEQSSAPVRVSPKAMKKPSFAQGLKPTKFGEGELGRLEAKLNPNEDGSIPDVEWLKDGKPLTEADGVKFIKNPDGTVALEIPNCKPSDAGKYTLRAKNPDGGSAESTAPAEVVSRKPAFETELKGLKLTEGDELKLVCKVKSETPITAKWFKDGKEVPADTRAAQKVEPDGTVLLVIANCEPGDAGKYRCEVTNQYGTSPSEADVTVQAMKREKPLFIDGLKATAFDEGKPGKLEAKIGGFPKPEIQWLKDGKPISDPRLKVETKPDGTTTLKIDNVKPEDAGEYAIVAKNDQGESKSSAPVTVNKKPSFLKPLQDCTVPAGQTAKFDSQVAGSPKPKIEWLKDGKPLKPDGKRIVAEEDDKGNCGLTIKDCTPADAGVYAIKATNPMGEMRSDAPLGIQDEKAPVFLSPLKDQAVAEGSKLVLEAKVMGTPAPEVKWFKNGKPVTEADGAKISFDGETARLEIPKAAMTDAGQYECKLVSPSGEQSSKANVKVLKPPKFIKPLSDTEVTLGAPLVLECEVLCDDEPEISWTYRGAPIHDGAKYTITKTGTKCKLFIANPSVNDCGEFQCTAKNAAGQDSTACKGTIKEAELKPDSGEPPSFLKKLTDQELLAGSTAKLIACIAGRPEPDVKWFKNDVEVVMTDRHSFERDRNGIIRLVIKNLEADDFGEYRCEISNTHGKAHCCCKLSEDTTDLKYRKKDEKPAWKKLNYQISEEPKDEGKKKKDRVANDTEPDNGDHSDTDDFGFERPNFDGEKPSVVKYLKPDTGIPPSITDAPDIVRMTDHDCTLRWKPSVPKGPRTPVTYRVEMCDLPGGAWKPYASGIKDTTTDVKGLRPGQDYQFRVLVESKHGLSEPSPPVTAHRSKLAEKDDKDVPEKEFKPKDIDLGHDLNKDGCAPYFVRKEEEVMFGVKGRPVSIEFWVYGLPHPECTWYFKDEKIESGGRYEKIQDRNGQVLLCINRMHEECEGIYTCKAVNVHGEATKSIRLELAEEPHFTKRLEYTTIMLRQNGTLQCRCVGKPYPNIRWYKDWLPLATSGRTQISWEEPDLCTLKLDDSIMRDAGLYSCKATNIAGDATCSATVVIEQEEELYDLSTYKAPRVVRPRTKPFRDYYDIGEELGRGTQGVTYHAVARATGNSYAAKIMHHKDPQFKQWMKNEMDTMNQLAHPKLCRMWDAFESPDSMSLIMDLCGGGELLNNIIKRGGITEGQVANYIRQTLQGLDYMHARGIGHLGLTLGDLLVARVDADDIKIGDFSLATRIHHDRNFIQEYGHPEYVAPELAKKEPATLASDMWSVGVITYILLSGVSPFLGEHDRETLSNIKDGKMSFLPEGFDGVSDDARDFVAKLMVFEPEGRLNVKAALNHPWLKMADLPDRGPKLGNYERLIDYQEKWKKWYANANCRTCFRRRTLESCFYHPSKMIYPPGEPYTPPESPAHREREHVGPGFNYERKKRKYDTENFKNESNYAQGPDTYLLQLRDTDFPLRLRQYMKVGASRSPSLAASLRGQHWGGSDIFARGQEREHIYPQVVIRERRKFHDMMDEEIDDEKKGGDDHKSILLRLNKEVGAVGYIKNQTDAVRDDAWRFRGVTREEAIGTLPFFREKIDDAVIMDSNNVSFTAVAVGTPLPQFTWFRNDCPLLPTSRIKIDTDEKTGTSVLTLAPGMAYDAGVFKCVARNASGTAVCRARLRMGDTPGRPAAPKVAQATSKQMYVEWNAPRQENNARTLFFTLEYKKSTDAEWQRIPEKITNEFYIVEDLQPGTKYEFRVTATNSFGNSVTSDASKAVSTEAADSTNKIKLSPTHSYQQVQTTDIAVGSAPVHDYSREQNPIPLKTSNAKDEYNFSAELSSGRFSVVMSATSKANSRLLAVKAVKNGKREYDMLKGLVHRNIVYLEDAFQNGDIALLVMERLSMNILAFLTLRNTYTEDQVSRVMKQVLDALEYLHFKGLVFCNVEPDSVCVTDGQSCIVKLVDFGSTHPVPKGGAQIAIDTEPEYMAPEVVRGEPVTYAADVWSAGVLMYILLSGVSPFLGATEAETRENVSMVRFHFESIYKECSSEATKLLIQVFKKCPTKRATIEECYENRWMLPSEYMLRKREACVFPSEKLAQFAQNYERAKRNRDNACMLLSNFGLNRITSPEA